MAEGNGNGNGAGVSQEEQDERRPTERVILKRVSAIVLPVEAVDPERLAAVVETLYPKAKRAERERAVVEGWVEVARRTGSSKKAAIEAHTGRAGTPDAEVGAFKAPSSTAWKGGLVLEAPPQPLVTARELDE